MVGQERTVGTFARGARAEEPGRPRAGFAVPAMAVGRIALLVEDGWADDLASVTLSGSEGSVTLDETADSPAWRQLASW